MVELFDKRTGMLLLDERVQERESYRKVLDDHVVTGEEVAEQADLVLRYFRRMDETLNEKDKELASDLICELAVLYEIANQLHGQE